MVFFWYFLVLATLPPAAKYQGTIDRFTMNRTDSSSSSAMMDDMSEEEEEFYRRQQLTAEQMMDEDEAEMQDEIIGKGFSTW